MTKPTPQWKQDWDIASHALITRGGLCVIDHVTHNWELDTEYVEKFLEKQIEKARKEGRDEMEEAMLSASDEGEKDFAPVFNDGFKAGYEKAKEEFGQFEYMNLDYNDGVKAGLQRALELIPDDTACPSDWNTAYLIRKEIEK